MAMVKASLMLFGGDTLVVRCSERCHIHLMSAKAAGDSHADILSVQDRDSAYLTVPYNGTWNVLIDSHSQSLEHSISYVSRLISPARDSPGIFQASPGWLFSPSSVRTVPTRSSRQSSCIPSLRSS